MSPAGSKNAPEARARGKIDALLAQAGWLVQNRDSMNLTAAEGIASALMLIGGWRGRSPP